MMVRSFHSEGAPRLTLRDTRRRDGLIALVAVLGCALYVLYSAANGGPGLTLDDSWIHQTYGRNLAQTGEWAFIPGVPSAGSTSPAYTVLLAAGYVLGVPHLLWVYLTGALALALCAVFSAHSADLLFPTVRRVGLWAGLAVALSWHLLWAAMSGMETAHFAALCMAALWFTLRAALGEQPVRVVDGAMFGLLGGLLIATRPEGALLIALCGAAVALSGRAGPGWLVGAAVGGGLILAPYLTLNLRLTGQLVPNTAAAKQAQIAPLLSLGVVYNLRAMLQPLTPGGQLALLPGLAFGALYLWRRKSEGWRRAAIGALPLIWPAALIMLYVLRLPAPYHHGRYVMPALPPLILVGVGGTAWFAARYAGRAAAPALRIAARTLIVGVPLVFLVFWWIGLLTYARDVRTIQSDFVATANWLQANVPPDEMLAVHDIGAVGYFASNVNAPRRILDVAGLVSPEAIAVIYNPQGLYDLIRARDVRWLMVLPVQWQDIWLGDPTRWGWQFCEVFNAEGGLGGMRIYEFREAGCR